jgi:hypothetical protein
LLSHNQEVSDNSRKVNEKTNSELVQSKKTLQNCVARLLDITTFKHSCPTFGSDAADKKEFLTEFSKGLSFALWFDKLTNRKVEGKPRTQRGICAVPDFSGTARERAPRAA